MVWHQNRTMILNWKMMKTQIYTWLIMMVGGLLVSTCGPTPTEKPAPNILFIAVDDLRPELGCYGVPHVRSPHIDKLAAEGMVFTNHFVAVPTCGASRFALLTGQLPETGQHLRNDAMASFLSGQPESARPESFVHHLRRNGYYTVGIGKISHHPDGLVYGYTESPEGAPWELPHSWDEMLLNSAKWGTGWNAFFGYADGSNRNTLNGEVKPYEKGAVDDTGYPDGLIADLAVEKLHEMKRRDQPFFLGVGFFKPHLPFTSPEEYWEMYEEDDIPLTPSPDVPANVSEASLHGSNELNRYAGGEEKASLEQPLSDDYQQKLKHAYCAAVSYIDAQVGKVLRTLDSLDLSENTIVVLWGDHGWHLGDQRVWGKHTCFEKALRSALIIRQPGVNGGLVCDNVVSTIDLYPTLMDFCQLDMPYTTQGSSMRTLLEDGTSAQWEDKAYSYFRQGISVRNSRYRLTKYFRDEQPDIELFDHAADPNENNNIAPCSPKLVKELLPLLEKGNTGLYD
jgi:arylsulfatase A-like enzyme